MSFLFGKPKEEIIAIFDIGNGSVGGAIVKLVRDHSPIILHTYREPITYMPQVTSERLLESMLQLLHNVSLELRDSGLPHAKELIGSFSLHRAHCIFSSPWYVSQTHILRVKKEKDFTATGDLIDDLVKKEQDSIEQTIKEGAYDKVFGDDIMLFEKKIIHTKLNGYQINQPIGKRAKEIEITFFSSFISKNIISEVERSLNQVFHFTKIEYSSYALASWSAVRDMFHSAEDFLFVDITAEVTDITLTLHGVLTETISFPLGRASIVRKIVEALTIPPEVALSFIDMYHKGTLEDKFKTRLAQVIDETTAAWYESFTESLKDLQKYYVLPRKIYCTVDPDVETHFREAFKKEPPKELTVLQDGFEVAILNTESVRPYAEHSAQAISDSFITIESIFSSKIR